MPPTTHHRTTTAHAWIDLAALLTSAGFAGIALGISLVEHPVRMRLCREGGGAKDALIEWKRSYDRAAPVQASLAALTAALGGVGAWMAARGGDQHAGAASASTASFNRAWLWGCLLTGLNIPVTLLCISPLNDRLQVRAVRALEQEAEMGAKAKADAAAASEETAEADAGADATCPALCFGSFAVKGLPSTTMLLRAWGCGHAVRTVLGCVGFAVLAFEAVVGGGRGPPSSSPSSV